MQNREHMNTIPQKVMEKYNAEQTLQVTYTEKGLASLQLKYRNLKALPAFLHNTMRGRPSPYRDLILENSRVFTWADDGSFVTLPNSSNEFNLFKDQRTLKKYHEGFSLVSWVVDSRILKKFSWKKTDNINESFICYLQGNDNTYNTLSSYQFFNRSNSQVDIKELELSDSKPYLATLLDLTADNLPLLRAMKETNELHLVNDYGVMLSEDKVEMYFHFPYAESTTTLHLHIRVNQGRHPMEIARSFSLDDIINWLESGYHINQLILKRSPMFCDNIQILYGIDGIEVESAINPYVINNYINITTRL
jgi:hypothetical protein